MGSPRVGHDGVTQQQQQRLTGKPKGGSAGRAPGALCLHPHPSPASPSASSLPGAQRCLLPGRPGMCPQQPDSGPTLAPGQLLAPPGWTRGSSPPSQAQSEQRAPCAPSRAPYAINHKRRCWGAPGAVVIVVSGARAQFLSVLTPQTGSKQHERNQSENVGGGSWTSKTPFRPHRLQY